MDGIPQPASQPDTPATRPDLVGAGPQDGPALSYAALAQRLVDAQREAADLRTVLDAAPSMIGYWDKQLRNRFANRAFALFLKVDPLQLQGKHLGEVLPPEAFARAQPRFEAVLRGEPQTYEQAIFRVDDPHTVRQGQVLLVPDIRDGQVLGFIDMVFDITSIRQAEARIAESERRYRHALEIGKVGTFVHDLTSEVYVFDAQAQTQFGLQTDRLTIDQLLALVHPDDRPFMVQDLQQREHLISVPLGDTHPAEGRISKTGLRVQRPDGDHSLEMFSELLFESNGFRRMPYRLVATVVDVTVHKQVEAQIRKLAFFDALTGLPNRRLLQERLQQAQSRHVRHRTWGAVLFIDLDKFKALNDTLGHDMGDLLLVQVGRRLTGCCRESDTVGRLGGDEFLVMLEDVARARTEAVANVERTCAAMLHALNQPYALGPHQHRSTPSIGVTLFNGKDADLDQLIKQADLAMYRAKAAGRNTMKMFDPALDGG